MLATCGNDNVLRVWSSSTGDCLKEMSHHSKEVSSVAWLPDSKLTYIATFIVYALAELGNHINVTAGLMIRPCTVLTQFLIARGLRLVQHPG